MASKIPHISYFVIRALAVLLSQDCRVTWISAFSRQIIPIAHSEFLYFAVPARFTRGTCHRVI